MKRLLYVFAFVLGLSVLFIACEKAENDPPKLTNIVLAADNSKITVTFSEPVYAKNDKTGNLTAANFNLSVVSASAVKSTYTVTHTAGEATAVINLTITTATVGDEVVEVSPANATSIYDADGAAMLSTEKLSTSKLAQNLGIIGEWNSYDISGVLRSLGYDEKITAKFNSNNTYEVTTSLKTVSYVLKGTFKQEKSTSGNIWNITLNQTSMNSSPTDLTSQGIFEVYKATNDSMYYEVAQSNPAIAGVTPPTPQAGFGSTSSGAFKKLNIQKYKRK
jgi:hypothetical protein